MALAAVGVPVSSEMGMASGSYQRMEAQHLDDLAGSLQARHNSVARSSVGRE